MGRGDQWDWPRRLDRTHDMKRVDKICFAGRFGESSASACSHSLQRPWVDQAIAMWQTIPDPTLTYSSIPRPPIGPYRARIRAIPRMLDQTAFRYRIQ